MDRGQIYLRAFLACCFFSILSFVLAGYCACPEDKPDAGFLAKHIPIESGLPPPANVK